MSGKKNKFILKVLDKVFTFLSKFRCVCCSSTCIVSKTSSLSEPKAPPPPSPPSPVELEELMSV